MITIELNNNIQNASLQVGDFAYFSSGYTTGNGSPITHASSPELIGKITAIGSNFIEINNPTNTTTINDGDFLMFSKYDQTDGDVIGYYAQVKFLNNSLKKAELFSVGSEVIINSK